MGFNNSESLKVIFDIETAPLPDAAEYMDPVEPIAPLDLSLITPAKNLVDPAKVEADLARRRMAAAAAHAEQVKQQEVDRVKALERCALDLDLCQIVAIGWQREDWDEPKVAVLDREGLEPAILKTFWSDLRQRVTIGYNTLGFDLPVLMRRSLYLGIQHPFVNIDRYRTNHIDLQQRLSHNGAFKFKPLSFYCKRFKIASEDTTSGKDIGQFVAEGNWQAVADHCRADVVKTRLLAERMGLLKAPALQEQGAF